MYITFLRSSLLSTEAACQGRACIEYNIGRRGEINKSALIGSTVHAVMEGLALAKLANQNGEIYFTHIELGEWVQSYFDPMKFFEFVYNKYEKEHPGIFERDSHQECETLIKQALAFNGGAFDPRKCDVLAVEYPFDIEIEEDWAAYNYEGPDGPLKGFLKLKGTSDLLTLEDKDTIHCIDYKTSRSLQDWGTGKFKDEDSLYDDIQLKFYYYALAKCFPTIANIMITIYFIRLDKPFTIIFDRDTDLPKIENWISAEYRRLKLLEQPEFIVGTDRQFIKNSYGTKTNKCKYCPHFTNMEPGTGKTVCNYFKEKFLLDGYDKVMQDKCDWSTLSSYGHGASITRD